MPVRSRFPEARDHTGGPSCPTVSRVTSRDPIAWAANTCLSTDLKEGRASEYVDSGSRHRVRPEEALVILLAQTARQRPKGRDRWFTAGTSTRVIRSPPSRSSKTAFRMTRRIPDASDSNSVHADRGAGAAPDSIHGASPQWRTLERAGDPAEQILAAAQQLDADVIVVGARGMGRMRRLLVGSVALSVSRHASCSVLAVRRLTQPIHSVLVATDGSSPAHAAVKPF